MQISRFHFLGAIVSVPQLSYYVAYDTVKPLRSCVCVTFQMRYFRVTLQIVRTHILVSTPINAFLLFQLLITLASVLFLKEGL